MANCFTFMATTVTCKIIYLAKVMSLFYMDSFLISVLMLRSAFFHHFIFTGSRLPSTYVACGQWGIAPFTDGSFHSPLLIKPVSTS